MKRSLQNGKWFELKSEEEHKQLKAYGSITPKDYGFANVQIGVFNGPGRYMLLHYNQRCPRDCCYEDVNEVLTVADVAKEAKQEMLNYAKIAHEAQPMKVCLIQKVIEHDWEPNLDYKVPFAVSLDSDQADRIVEQLDYRYSHVEIDLLLD